MAGSRWLRGGLWTAIAFYAVIALEVIIMITPFAGYFYSVYAPVLGVLEARPATAWLTAFFLPHVSYTGDPLLGLLAWLGPVFLGLGLAIFLVGAFQVYAAKLTRKGVVRGGVYRFVRHPQYTGLALAGLGLLLYWPRFIILLLYLGMLLAYYLLARHEEREMTRRHFDAYPDFAGSRPMFLPGFRSRAAAGRPEGGAKRWVLAFAATLALALGGAFALRAYSEARLTRVEEENVVSLSLFGGDVTALGDRVAAVLEASDVSRRLAPHPPSHGLVAYVLPRDYMMQHLLADLSEHESHHGGAEDGGVLAALGHLLRMYALAPRRQLASQGDTDTYRVLFAEAVRPGGDPVPPERVLDAGVLRLPLFFVDVEEGRVAMTMDTPARHTWDRVPVPAF